MMTSHVWSLCKPSLMTEYDLRDSEAEEALYDLRQYMAEHAAYPVDVIWCAEGEPDGISGPRAWMLEGLACRAEVVVFGDFTNQVGVYLGETGSR